ncbi:hypothetical protein FBF28_03820 [Candidatus Saccharibacteria bacterium oral taxon 488]|nr:hypothetical protein FBF28_03820 [Candidatus Saccharibacteria bacterium oral taxon 488]
MIFRTMPRPDLEITWYRQNGVFNFTNSDGEPVTGVSAQTWEDYLDHIENLPSKVSGQVISPELITITDIPFEKVARGFCSYVRFHTIYPMPTSWSAHPFFVMIRNCRITLF